MVMKIRAISFADCCTWTLQLAQEAIGQRKNGEKLKVRSEREIDNEWDSDKRKLFRGRFCCE